MNTKLFYTEHGSGKPLILLHGNGEDGSYFKNQIPFFQKNYRVIAVDTRGHGKSPRGTASMTLSQFVSDLEGFMNDLAIASAHILGFSDGANIALLFALAHPSRVSALVLNGGNLFPMGLTEQTRLEIEGEYQEALAANDKRQLELLRLMIDEPAIEPSSLSALKMPVLVVAGTDDMIEENHTRLIASSIPNATLSFIEGSHFVAAENPDAFNHVVDEFFNNVINSVGRY